MRQCTCFISDYDSVHDRDCQSVINTPRTPVFTDNDLKALKLNAEYCQKNSYAHGIYPLEVLDLIHRLEAAEVLCKWVTEGGSYPSFGVTEWQKAAGKE